MSKPFGLQIGQRSFWLFGQTCGNVQYMWRGCRHGCLQQGLDAMNPFPQSVLKPRHAVLAGEPHNASLDVLLAPFYWKDALADTSIRLDGIDLPSVYLAALAGKRFSFPLNPDAGAIDGSIYLGNAHHPVDVSSLEFVRDRHGGLKVVIKGMYVFEFEGLDSFPNTAFVLAVSVSSCAV